MLVSPTLFGLTHDELAEENREKAEREEGAATGETSPLFQIHLIDIRVLSSFEMDILIRVRQ